MNTPTPEQRLDQLAAAIDAEPHAPLAKAHRAILLAYEGSQRQMDRYPADDAAKDPLAYSVARGYLLGISRAVEELLNGYGL